MDGGESGIYVVWNDRDRTDTVQPEYCYEMMKQVAQCLRGGLVPDQEAGWAFQSVIFNLCGLWFLAGLADFLSLERIREEIVVPR